MGILAGKDEFESERGAWSTLAGPLSILPHIWWIDHYIGSKIGPTKPYHTMPYTGDALLLADGSYIPEFTAFVASENIRLLQLKRADYFADGGRGTGHINFSDIQS